MGFFDKAITVDFRPGRPAASPEQRLRRRMLNLIEKQLAIVAKPNFTSKGGRKTKSWFHTIGEEELFIPIYRGKNFVEVSTDGEKNALPVAKDKRSTLQGFKETVEAGEHDKAIEMADSGKGRPGRKRRRRGRPRKS
jgi:hypothetical protein